MSSTPILNNISPFKALYHSPLSYSPLCIFGCLCFVHLPSFERTKLSQQAAKFVLLGYNDKHKKFLCYDLEARWIRISHHVIFVEDVPYYSLSLFLIFFMLPIFLDSMILLHLLFYSSIIEDRSHLLQQLLLQIIHHCQILHIEVMPSLFLHHHHLHLCGAPLVHLNPLTILVSLHFLLTLILFLFLLLIHMLKRHLVGKIQ